MADHQPGPECVYNLGRDWIDPGTMCCIRSAPPGAKGQQAPTTATPRNHRKSAGRRNPAVAVKHFSGSGPHRYLGKGLAAMITTDLTKVKNTCHLIVVEWERRADLLREIELSNSPYFDPSTRIQRGRIIDPDVFVTGSVATTQTDSTWHIELVTAQSELVIGRDQGSAKGTDILDATMDIAERLASRICKWWSRESRLRDPSSK